ncbi:MAG: hypothetical protein P1U63_09725 [Coxiellaceae bacterium]|nr:hypothetical protein [Coxiellaceae bacterium]
MADPRPSKAGMFGRPSQATTKQQAHPLAAILSSAVEFAAKNPTALPGMNAAFNKMAQQYPELMADFQQTFKQEAQATSPAQNQTPRMGRGSNS